MYQDVLISPVALAAAQHAGGTVVLDCRFQLADPDAGRRGYGEGHIPGAHYMDLDRDLSRPKQAHGGRHPLPDSETLAARLRAAGVSADTLVVAYDDARFAFAARMWWLLRYLGHQHVRVLNGGYAAWKAADMPVTQALPGGAEGDFIGVPNGRMIVDRHALLQRGTAAPSPLIDAREETRYRGEHEPIDPVAGHIPGALCHPWQAFTDGDGNAISETANRERWAWLDADAHPIVYCGSGVTACVNLLSLYAAGYRGARLYPGSWSDWCAYADAPIAKGK